MTLESKVRYKKIKLHITKTFAKNMKCLKIVSIYFILTDMISKYTHTLNEKTFAMCNDRSRDKIPLTITLATYTDIYKRFWEKCIVAQALVKSVHCTVYSLF